MDCGTDGEFSPSSASILSFSIAIILTFVFTINAFSSNQSRSELEIIGVSQTIRNDTRNLFLDIEAIGAGRKLTKSEFKIFDNGTEKSIQKVVMEESRTRLLDIVFLVDNSGSMEPIQQAVNSQLKKFVDRLSNEGFNLGLGLCRFGFRSTMNKYPPIDYSIEIENRGHLTTDVRNFKKNILSKNVADGGFEPGWAALMESSESFNFRPGSLRVFVLIANETIDLTPDGYLANDRPLNYSGPLQKKLDSRIEETKEEILAKWKDRVTESLTNIMVFPLVVDTEGAEDDYCDVTEPTGGTCFKALPKHKNASKANGKYIERIQSAVDSLFKDIVGRLSDSYRLVYQTGKEECRGAQGSVRISTEARSFKEVDQAVYPCSPLRFNQISVEQSNETKFVFPDDKGEKHPGNLAERKPVKITANLTGGKKPFEVELYYKTLSGGKKGVNFQSLSMQQDPSEEKKFQAKIPASYIERPGISYYLVAKGDTSKATFPPSNPSTNPLQKAVEPNQKPIVEIEGLENKVPNEPLEISAQVNDNDNVSNLDLVALHYRKPGQILYRSIEMLNRSGSHYVGQIPAEDVTTEGLEYYVTAKDSYGVIGQAGRSNEPLEISIQEIAINVHREGNSFYFQIRGKGITASKSVKITGDTEYFSAIKAEQGADDTFDTERKSFRLTPKTESLEPGFYPGSLVVEVKDTAIRFSSPWTDTVSTEDKVSFSYEIVKLGISSKKFLKKKNVWNPEIYSKNQGDNLPLQYNEVEVEGPLKKINQDLVSLKVEKNSSLNLDYNLKSLDLNKRDSSIDIQWSVGPYGTIKENRKRLNEEGPEAKVTFDYKQKSDSNQLVILPQQSYPVDVAYRGRSVRAKLTGDFSPGPYNYGDEAFCLLLDASKTAETDSPEIAVDQDPPLVAQPRKFSIGEDENRVCFQVDGDDLCPGAKCTFSPKIDLSLPNDWNWRVGDTLNSDFSPTKEGQNRLQLTVPELVLNKPTFKVNMVKQSGKDEGYYHLRFQRSGYGSTDSGVVVEGWSSHFNLKDADGNSVTGTFKGDELYLYPKVDDLSPGMYEGEIRVKPESDRVLLDGEGGFEYRNYIVALKDFPTQNLWEILGQEGSIHDLKINIPRSSFLGLSQVSVKDISIKARSRVEGLDLKANIKRNGGDNSGIFVQITPESVSENFTLKERLSSQKRDVILQFDLPKKNSRMIKGIPNQISINLSYNQTIKCEENNVAKKKGETILRCSGSLLQKWKNGGLKAKDVLEFAGEGSLSSSFTSDNTIAVRVPEDKDYGIYSGEVRFINENGKILLTKSYKVKLLKWWTRLFDTIISWAFLGFISAFIASLLLYASRAAYLGTVYVYDLDSDRVWGTLIRPQVIGVLALLMILFTILQFSVF